MNDPSSESDDRAEVGVPTAAEPDDLTAYTIFLCGEGEGSEPGFEKKGGGIGEQV